MVFWMPSWPALHEYLDRARQLQHDLGKAERTARMFYASMNGSGSPSAKELVSGGGRGQTAQPARPAAADGNCDSS